MTVSGLAAGATSITAGFHHSCAATGAGAITCWGLNDHGQLGDGTRVNRTRPAQVVGLSRGASLPTGGWSYSCAVAAGGVGKCWGANESGQLGNGTTTSSLVPVTVR